MNKMSRWYFRFPEDFYALGPTTKRLSTEKKAREYIKKCWEIERLPRGFELWRAN
jgi:hypothetical protein